MSKSRRQEGAYGHKGGPGAWGAGLRQVIPTNLRRPASRSGCDADAEGGGMGGVGTTEDLPAQVVPAAVDTLGLGRRALHAAIRDPRLLGCAGPGLPWAPPLSDGEGRARPGVGIPCCPHPVGPSGAGAWEAGLGGGSCSAL